MKFQHQPHRQRGFTLVVTSLMMVMLAILTLGLLTLSSVSLRSSTRDRASAIAKANARLALTLAIGQLQETAGPDRRVTATADILKSSDPSKKHWTGVWSTEEWNPVSPDKKSFVAWLTNDTGIRSGNNESSIETPLTLIAEGSRKITLVGAGTLGKSTPDAHVALYTTPIRSGRQQTGGFAYWVGDEGVKARYNLTQPETETPDAPSVRWSAAAQTGIQKIVGLENYTGLDRRRIASTATFQTIGLAQHKKIPDGLFHDITTDSEGLPVDVRLGGPRQDLSLAFELPIGEFNALEEFHNANEVNDTNWYNTLGGSTYSREEFYPGGHKLGYLFQIPLGRDRLRGPTWDLLRNHARLYKKEWESFSWERKQPASQDAIEARGSLPMSYAAIRYPGQSVNGRWGEFSNEGMVFGKPVKVYNESVSRHQPYSTSYNPAVNTLRRTSQKIAPIVTRVTFALGLVRGTFPYSGVDQETIGVSMDPYFTILNPYNKPIEFHSIGFYASKFNPFEFTISYRGVDGSPREETFNSSENIYNQGSLSFRLNPASTGGIMRLEPGEMRVISPSQIAGGVRIDRVGATPLSGTAQYQEDSGIVIIPKTPARPASAASVTLRVRGRNAATQEADSLTFSLFLPKLHSGQIRDVVTDLPPVANVQLNTDAIDDPLIQRLGFTTVGFPEIRKTVGGSQIPRVGEFGLYVAALDLWIKDFETGDRPVLAQFNPRASAIDPRDYDGTHRVSPAWSAELITIDDVSSLGIATAYGTGRWGGGIGSGGITRLCLYDIPQGPLTSLASLQHADVGGFATDAPYAIGNSFPPPTLKLDQVAAKANIVSSQFTDWNGHSHMDVSWAANEALWDRYFFSGLSWDGSSGRPRSLDSAVEAILENQTESPFANPRIRLADRPADEDRLKNYGTIADHLIIRGAFNINSTSVNAWKAVLASLDQAELSYLHNGSERTGSFDIPISRFSMPIGGPEDKFLGFRSLNDAELESLAEEIVEEVKSRGPFMGLSDFVNRRLESGDHGEAGTIQAAIDRTRINAGLGNATSASNVANKMDSTSAGIPGYLMQADVLTAIGSFIASRSDTFKIRTYGEATDVNGKVLARAWCEAIVQRQPAWMEQTNVSATIPNPDYPGDSSRNDAILRPFIANPDFPKLNLHMGRRFSLASFRWLSPAEI